MSKVWELDSGQVKRAKSKHLQKRTANINRGCKGAYEGQRRRAGARWEAGVGRTGAVQQHEAELRVVGGDSLPI